MRNFFKRLKISYNLFKLLKDPKLGQQALAEIECVTGGHNWGSTFDPKKPIERKVAERTFCKVCGQRYHMHHFKL